MPSGCELDESVALLVFLDVGLEAPSASRLVGLGATHDDALLGGHDALRLIGRAAAAHADGERLGDVLRNREKLGHGVEGLAQVVSIETRHDQAFPSICELDRHLEETLFEELSFVDADDFGTVVELFQNLFRVLDELGVDLHVTVGDDMLFAIAAVDQRFEDLDSLTGDLSSSQPSNQLFALPTEHAPGNDL